MKNPDKTNDCVNISVMLDFYGQMLTEKSLRITELYYNEDMSLSEISENYNITRQAVHDKLKRSVGALKEYEAKLQLVKRFNEQRRTVEEVLEDLEEKNTSAAKKKLQNLISSL